MMRTVRRSGQYTRAQDAVIRALYTRQTMRKIAELLGRDPNSVNARARSLGCTSHQWTEPEEQFLRIAHGRLPAAEIGAAIRRSEHAVNVRVSRLDIGRGLRGQRWSNKEDEVLHQLYLSTPIGQLVSRLGRTEKAIRSRAESLGIRKRRVLTDEARELLWEMRDDPDSIPYLAEYFGLKEETLRRTLAKVRRRRSMLQSKGKDGG